MTEVASHDAQGWDDDPVPLEIAPVETAGGPGLRVAGELDLAGCDRLIESVAAAARPGAPLHVDLRAVTFLDSTGVRALQTADLRARERGADEVRFVTRGGGYPARVLGMFDAGHALLLDAED